MGGHYKKSERLVLVARVCAPGLKKRRTIVVRRRRECSRVGLASAFGTFRTSGKVRFASAKRGITESAMSPNALVTSFLVTLAVTPLLR